jgi:PAS domain S-box-containing protein
MHFIPLPDPDGRVRRFLGSGVDITDRKRHEETIKVREDTIKSRLFYEESISFCSQILVETVDLDTALQQVVDEIVSVAKTGRSFIFKNISPQAGKICVRQINQSVVEGVEPKLPPSSSDSSSCNDLSAELLAKLTAGRPYGGTLPQMSRQDMSALASVEEGSVLILPIKVEDTLWGLIGFEDATAERRWKQEDIQLLRTVGSMIGTTIERKRAEKELRESEERYRVFTEEALVGVYISHHGSYLFVNPAMEKITGYSKKELLEIHPYDLVLPDGQKTLLNRHDAANRGEEVPADYTIPIRRKDGEVAVLQIRTHPIVYEGKSAYLGNCVDITELIGQREQIEQAKQAWESTFDSISDLVMILDSEYNIMRANRAVAEYTGFDIKDVIGRSYLEVFNLESVFTDSKGLPKTDSMLPEHFEINDYKRERIFSVSASSLRDPLGKTVATVHVARDISQMRVMEKALASSEAQFRGLAESAQDMIFNIDLDGTIRYVNPAMQHTFGYDPSELVGGNLASILQVDQEASSMDKPLLAHLLSSDDEGRIPLFEIKTQDVKGRKHVLEVSARRLAQQIIGVVRDVSERKKMEQQLIHASKLASIGVLAAGIAHQVNNPLATMLATSSLLRSMLLGSEDVPTQLKEELSAYIDTMEEQVERTSRVVTGLLEFTQTKRSEVRPADVNSILTEALDLLSRHLSLEKLSVSIHTDLGADLSPALVDSTALQQVLVNVIQNSFEAMGVEGKLDVRTENTDSGMVRITISDNGPGVPPDLRDEIFEPLFTTKTDRKGTGLGLAISVMLLERFRGRIYLDDAPKEGASFVIEVPIQEGGTVEGENKEV